MDVFGPCLSAYTLLVMTLDFDVTECLGLLRDMPGGSDWCWEMLSLEVTMLWYRYLDCVFQF